MENNYLNLIHKEISNQISPEEKKVLDKWISENSLNMDSYDETKMSWELTKNICDETDFDNSKAWGKLNSRIANSAVKRERTFSLSTYLKIAASVIIVVCAGLLLYTLVPSDKVISANQNMEIFNLADGSEIWLSKNSDLTIDPNFNEEQRVVMLDGEAYFRIKRNPDKPFIIYSHKTQTKVLGTSFTIKAYREQEFVQVIVESGTVEFSNLDGSYRVILEKNDEAIYDTKTRQITRITSDKSKKNYPVRKAGKRKIENQDEILNEIVSPKRYLRNDFSLRTNIVKQTIIEGQIHNSAKITMYKNITLKTTYKTNGRLTGIQYHTITQQVNPGDSIKYKLKLDDWFKETTDIEVVIEDVQPVQ